MEIEMTEETGTKLAKFLIDAYKRRLQEDYTYSIRQFAGDIGIGATALHYLINTKGAEITKINIDTMNSLLRYFGPVIFEIIGVDFPKRSTRAIADKGGEEYATQEAAKEKLYEIWNRLTEKDRAEFLRRIKEGK